MTRGMNILFYPTLSISRVSAGCINGHIIAVYAIIAVPCSEVPLYSFLLH